MGKKNVVPKRDMPRPGEVTLLKYLGLPRTDRSKARETVRAGKVAVEALNNVVTHISTLKSKAGVGAVVTINVDVILDIIAGKPLDEVGTGKASETGNVGEQAGGNTGDAGQQEDQKTGETVGASAETQDTGGEQGG